MTAAVCADRECRRPLGRSPSVDWCSDVCQQRWTAAQNQVVPLTAGARPGVMLHGSVTQLGYRGATLDRLLGRS